MISARIHLSPRALKARVGTALIACLAGLGVWACSLNPQPIPPGFNDLPAATDAGRGGADVGVGPFNGQDGATAGSTDSSAPPQDAAEQDGGDAGDAASDAPSDAALEGGG